MQRVALPPRRVDNSTVLEHTLESLEYKSSLSGTGRDRDARSISFGEGSICLCVLLESNSGSARI